jgi:hypothetical protein
VIYAPIAAFSIPEELPSPESLGSVMGLAVVCTTLAFVLFFASSRRSARFGRR